MINTIIISSSGTITIDVVDGKLKIIAPAETKTKLINHKLYLEMEQTQFTGFNNISIGYGSSITINGVQLNHQSRQSTVPPVEHLFDHYDIQKIKVSGSAHINILSKFNLKTLSLNGSGVIKADGQYDTLNLALNGSGGIRLGNATIKNACISLNGSGSIKDFSVTDNINCCLNGSGSIKGSALTSTMINKCKNGSGSIQITKY